MGHKRSSAMVKIVAARVAGTAWLTVLWWGWSGMALPAHAGGAPAVAAASAAAANRQLRQGMIDFNSDVYGRRQAGGRMIDEAATTMVRALLKVRGHQGAAAVRQLLNYQRNLMRWAWALLRLPLAQRLALMQWAISSHALSEVAAAFAHKARDRENAALALGKMPGSNVSKVLELLLDDRNMAVRITSMNVLWNRRPTAAMFRAVWRRAMILGPQHPGMVGLPKATVKFRGRTIQILTPMMMVSGAGSWWGVQDGPLACRLLGHWKPVVPECTHLVVNYLRRACRQARAHPGQNVLSLTPWQIPVFRLAAMQNPRRTAPFLLYLAHRPLPPEINNLYFNNILMANGRFASNRTFPLEMLIWLAHQKISAYHISIFTVQLNGGIPVLASAGKAQESRDIARITKWFAAKGIQAATSAEFRKHPVAGETPPTIGSAGGARQVGLSSGQLQAMRAAQTEFWHSVKALSSGSTVARQRACEQIKRVLVMNATDLIRLASMDHPSRVAHLLHYQRRVATLAAAMME